MLTTEDRLEIQELYARYNHAIDFGDGPAWAACFSADGTFESGGTVTTGPDALAGFASAFPTRLKARHWTNNLVLDEGPDGVSGKCYLQLLRLTPGERPPASVLTTAIYHDRLTRTADGWRFASRKVVGDA